MRIRLRTCMIRVPSPKLLECMITTNAARVQIWVDVSIFRVAPSGSDSDRPTARSRNQTKTPCQHTGVATLAQQIQQINQTHHQPSCSTLRVHMIVLALYVFMC